MSAKKDMNASDRSLIERAALEPIVFTYAPALTTGKVKLVRSTISIKWKAHLHRLAVAGFLAESTTGCGGHGEPPETTIGFRATALGRGAIGLRAGPQPRCRRIAGAVDARADFAMDEGDGETI